MKKKDFSFEAKKTRRGFTLIELMVVMSIIGILMGLTLTGFLASRKAARDGKRKSDLEQIRSALEMCYADTNTYPLSIVNSVSCGTKTYLDSTPLDPVTSDPYYYSPSGTTYQLCAYLETTAPNNCGTAGCGSGRTCNYRVTNP